jgi:TDG/mug DNA glycosylase family protein
LVLEDRLAPGLRLVVCGTAAGTKSAQLKAYYAGPGNKFWKTLHQVGLTAYQLAPTDFRQAQQFGIGFTDLIKDQSGNDSAIDFRGDARDRLRNAILAARPTTLCFNGKRAAQEYLHLKQVAYGLQIETIGTTKLFVAPSTSGAASGAWNLSVWEDLAGLVLQGDV